MSWKIYHNPNCTKSKKCLAILEEKGLDPEVVLYKEVGLTDSDLDTIGKTLNMRPKEFIRTREDIYKENPIDLDDDLALRDLMKAHPILLERPVIIHSDKAVIGRPPENLKSLFDLL